MAELVQRWPQVVGEAIARNAWPARIARDGTVHVNTADSVWSFELGQRAAEIAGKLGVSKVRFAPGPLPEPDVEPVQSPVEVSPEDDERARARPIAAVAAIALPASKRRFTPNPIVRLARAPVGCPTIRRPPAPASPHRPGRRRR